MKINDSEVTIDAGLGYPDYYLYYDDNGMIYEASCVLSDKKHIILPSGAAYNFMINEAITDWIVKDKKLIKREIQEIATATQFNPTAYTDLNPNALIYSVEGDIRLPTVILYDDAVEGGVYFQ